MEENNPPAKYVISVNDDPTTLRYTEVITYSDS